jgi:hypothetical protein
MLLLMLSLMMINIKELKEECKEWDYNLEKVPYLDWIITNCKLIYIYISIYLYYLIYLSKNQVVLIN